jgi:hypothetical protein
MKTNSKAGQSLSSKPEQNLSPYLKAILSGKLLIARNENYYNNENADRAAASRYIRESKSTNKY